MAPEVCTGNRTSEFGHHKAMDCLVSVKHAKGSGRLGSS